MYSMEMHNKFSKKLDITADKNMSAASVVSSKNLSTQKMRFKSQEYS